MIEFFYETDFSLPSEDFYRKWLNECLRLEGYIAEEINYIFCDDSYLIRINQEHLNHDTYTDIITFDYTEGNQIFSDIYISIERVKDNAAQFKESFERELSRVMAHGILHLCGYKDKTQEEKEEMRTKEEECLSLQTQMRDKEKE